DKKALMHKLGKKQLTLHLGGPLKKIPEKLSKHQLELSEAGTEITHTYEAQGGKTGIAAFLDDVKKAGIEFTDVETTQSSLEEIFVSLVREPS
ncbi:MAG TPA: multidrug ABC transporter ATP-binding protein, partial [Aestuariivirga sp.]|nr:multidrug ABC transporter ATP-binding protein [Aestuariivirga sp.]